MKPNPLSIATAAGALLLGTTVALAPAVAYPPGTSLVVSATQTPIPGKAHNFVITITNGRPGCKAITSIQGRTKTTRLDSTGSATVSLSIAKKPGRYSVKVKTVSCKYNESTSTIVDVTDWKISHKPTAKKNTSFPVSAKGWIAKQPITFSLTNGSTTLTWTARTDSEGNAAKKVKAPYPGVWAITVSQNGHVSSGTNYVTVT